MRKKGPDGGQRARVRGAPTLTNSATAALAEAANAARRLGHDFLGPEHLLHGLLEEGSVRPLLAARGASVDALAVEARAAVARAAAGTGAAVPTAELRDVLRLAETEALRAGGELAPEHLFFALLAAPGGAATLLLAAGFSLDAAPVVPPRSS